MDGCGKSHPHQDSIFGPFGPYGIAIPSELPRPIVTTSTSDDSLVSRSYSWEHNIKIDWNDEGYEDMTWIELSLVGTSNGVPWTRQWALNFNKIYSILWLQENSSLQPNSVPCIHLAITIRIILNDTQITGKQFQSQSFQESPYDSLFCVEKWRLGAERPQEVSLGKWTLNAHFSM
jgi:hypothetical protein